MKRALIRAWFTGVLCATALCLCALAVFGQSPPEVEALASRTAERVGKTHQSHIFVAGLKGCQLDKEDCASYESVLREKIEKAIPGVRFIKRENVINILEGRGFLAFDAYIPDVLDAVASQAGADILVTYTVEWQGEGYELDSELFDAVRGKKLDELRARIARSASDSGGEPLVFTDPVSGSSFIISRGKQPRPPVVEYPICDKCPDPSYTPEARSDRIQGRVLLLVTVTVTGVPEQIGVIDGLRDGLTDRALEAVQNWHFRPAIGKDGKPFATRIPIEVTFRLQ